MAVAWEERLEQLERNFLAEVERLKHDILGQLHVSDDKYYSNIDNEVNTSFTHHPAALPSAVTSDAPPSNSVSPVHPQTSHDEENEGLSTPPESQNLHHSDDGGGHKSRRGVAPERSLAAAAPVVRVRAAFNFHAQEEDELSLPKGLELIAFMREDESWWWGQRPDGQVGIFPSNFVTVLEGDPDALPVREDDDQEMADADEHQHHHHQQQQHQQDDIGNDDGAHAADDGRPKPPPPPSGPKPLARQGSQQRLDRMKVVTKVPSPPPSQRSSSDAVGGGSNLNSSGSDPTPSSQPPPATSSSSSSPSSSSSSSSPPPASASTSPAPTLSSSSTPTPTAASAAVPPPARRPSPPAAHIKPSLDGASPPASAPEPSGAVGGVDSVDAGAEAEPGTRAAAVSRQRPPSVSAAPQGRRPLAQDKDGQPGAAPQSPKPAVPRAALKPTQRGEEARRDWHDKRKSIMMLQEQSRTTRLLAQWENAGLGITFAPPPRPN